MIESMTGCNWFTTLDFKSGYWQIQVAPDVIEKLAFSTASGHFEFLRMPYGTKNAPKTLGRIMLRIFGDCPFVKIYYDDMTISSKTFQEHCKHLKIIFDKSRCYDLRLNKAKCQFAYNSVKVLGYIVSGNEIKMDQDKIEVIET